jgi:hypothetical protein
VNQGSSRFSFGERIATDTPTRPLAHGSRGCPGRRPFLAGPGVTGLPQGGRRAWAVLVARSGGVGHSYLGNTLRLVVVPSDGGVFGRFSAQTPPIRIGALPRPFPFSPFAIRSCRMPARPLLPSFSPAARPPCHVSPFAAVQPSSTVNCIVPRDTIFYVTSE